MGPDVNAAAPPSAGYVWSDEFDGDAGAPIDERHWTHELGGSGWGNNEVQCYTDSPRNSSLDGKGNLCITARQETSGRYSSARVITKGKFEFAYGKIEARAKLPKGRGMWPALWMLGANLPETPWPICGEIDVLENLGHDTRTVYGTVHGPGFSGRHGVSGRCFAAHDLAADFHIYAVHWDPGSIRWHLDDKCYHVVTPDDLPGRRWVYGHPFFILLNLAVGGDWPGAPDASTAFPQTLVVDYIRVYQPR
jgi:beta-glucanase (GH16 family)